MTIPVFQPILSVRLTTSVASARVALPAATNHVRIFNNSTATAWVLPGNSAVTSAFPTAGTAGAGFAVAAGATEVFRLPFGTSTTHVAAILDAGTGVLEITSGDGQ